MGNQETYVPLTNYFDFTHGFVRKQFGAIVCATSSTKGKTISSTTFEPVALTEAPELQDGDTTYLNEFLGKFGNAKE